jgi:hypothetical protein
MAVNNVFLRTKPHPQTYFFQGGTATSAQVPGLALVSGGTYFKVTPPDNQNYNVKLRKGVKYVLGTVSQAPAGQVEIPTVDVFYQQGGSRGSEITLKKASS